MIFLWLQHQTFYRRLQEQAITSIDKTHTQKVWADIGCSTGLMTRLAEKLKYTVIGYDLNTFSLSFAQVLSLTKKNISYERQDFYTIDKAFDVVTATSLLSVVEDKSHALEKLFSLVTKKNGDLLIIEPTSKLSRKNVWKLIHNVKTFWFYKGLLLWAIAREKKHIDIEVFDTLVDVSVTHRYSLNDMVRISHIKI